MKKLVIENLSTKELKRFILKGACLIDTLQNICMSDGEIAMTDGNRLNILKTKTNIKEKLFLHRDFIEDVKKEKTINIYEDNNFIYVNNNQYVKNIYNYPNYKQLLTSIKNYTNKITINNKTLLKVLMKIKKYVNKETKVVILDFKNNKIVVENVENYEKKIFYMNYIFDFNENIDYIAFNINYLIDLLKFMENDFVLSFYSAVSAVYANNNNNKETLLMPVQIRYNYEFKETFINVEKEENINTSEDIKEEKEINNKLIKAEVEEEEKEINHTHINYLTGHEYAGNNLKVLNDFMIENNYKETAWLGSYQAKKVKLQLKKNAKPVIIQVFHENLDGTIFKMSESIYNIADFEPLKKIEDTEDFKNIINELKKAV